MESTPTQSSGTAEIANSLGAYVVRKRPLKSLKGIGFVSMLWVRDALNDGLFSNTRSYTVASVIAAAGDCDGRYCFLYLASMAKRCGNAMSVPTIKRAIRDLVKAGLVRKLNRQQTRAFFAEELAEGKRWADRLPCVLELMIPASAYPEPTLVEINEVRAKLGEEPLDDTTRPYPPVGTTDQIGEDDGSCCDTDPSHSDTCPRKTPVSVRGTSSTGEENRQKPRCSPFDIIDRIPGIHLTDPVADRGRLKEAVAKLLHQGLSVGDARALLSGLDPLERPFPALMRRLYDMSAAHRYLNGSLGRGIHGADLSAPSWPVLGEDDDQFAKPEQFLVDPQGRVDGTCPQHRNTRNFPGGNCVICGRRCRSVPGELMHEPESEPAAPPGDVPAPRTVVPPQVAEEPALDPELLGRMSSSLADGSVTGPVRDPRAKAGLSQGSGISTGVRTALDGLRHALRDSPPPKGGVPAPRGRSCENVRVPA